MITSFVTCYRINAVAVNISKGIGEVKHVDSGYVMWKKRKGGKKVRRNYYGETKCLNARREYEIKAEKKDHRLGFNSCLPHMRDILVTA